MGAQRRGLVLLDALGALLIIGVLATVMAVAVSQQARGLRSVEQGRQALTIAQRALADLQTGARPQEGDEQTRIQVSVLDAEAPEGRIWVRVVVTHGSSTSELTGVVPRKASEVVR
jgi:type II secretory pathway pseudopilin PulG